MVDFFFAATLHAKPTIAATLYFKPCQSGSTSLCKAGWTLTNAHQAGWTLTYAHQMNHLWPDPKPSSTIGKTIIRSRWVDWKACNASEPEPGPCEAQPCRHMSTVA